MTTALRMSNLHVPTLREDPAETEISSHRLLLRAGMIRKVAAGIYTFLPLGWRSVRKIEQIVREEMEAIDSHELFMPFVQPAELWKDSGRWEAYGPELARLKDRHGREFCLGPTHEEIITSLVRGEVRSYRELPLSLFQINLKFRDEVRPRFGLLRGREFIMKDAYSFHATQESLQEHYEQQVRAYGRICERLGLSYRPVEADSGQIGGEVTTEFMALADTGEAELVYCDCGWAANVEAASTIVPGTAKDADQKEMERIHTPGIHSIADLAAFLDVPQYATVKTMAAKDADDRLVFFCIPGDRELNPVKASRAVEDATLLGEEEFDSYGIPVGSLGPVDPPANTRVIADASLRDVVSWTVGANNDDYHIVGAMPGRDFEVSEWADLLVARPGDHCPRCESVVEGARGIEVSQVFQLGTKYSEALGATFTAENGSEQPFIMGCYGVGITRSLAAVIEQHHDDAGIVWPISTAPLEVIVVPLSIDDAEVWPVAESVWRAISESGVETLIDDRDERAGVKFADADLVGYPYQVVVGKRGVAAGKVELKLRATGERVELPVDKAPEMVTRIVSEDRATYHL